MRITFLFLLVSTPANVPYSERRFPLPRKRREKFVQAVSFSMAELAGRSQNPSAALLMSD